MITSATSWPNGPMAQGTTKAPPQSSGDTTLSGPHAMENRRGTHTSASHRARVRNVFHINRSGNEGSAIRSSLSGVSSGSSASMSHSGSGPAGPVTAGSVTAGSVTAGSVAGRSILASKAVDVVRVLDHRLGHVADVDPPRRHALLHPAVGVAVDCQ